ncbi:hypothetical protein [Nonomuraea sp. KM90]|uniref:hypothetical protein n=1 Tax=Nonomuraea sp. KM90 TaxID=3457428 RepID=UPI003FCE2835
MTDDGTIPSGPNQGQDEPGPGARVANKAFGHYISRVMPGGRLTQVGGRASHYYGRITGPEVNLCGWLHKSAHGPRVDGAADTCSKRTANRMWQRMTIGKRFSAPAGTKGHNGTPVAVTPGTNCILYYNYFTDSTFKRGHLRDPGGHIGTNPASPGHIRYRYETHDGTAAVVFDDVHGWGFVAVGCLTMRDPTTNRRIKTFNDRDRRSSERAFGVYGESPQAAGLRYVLIPPSWDRPFPATNPADSHGPNSRQAGRVNLRGAIFVTFPPANYVAALA